MCVNQLGVAIPLIAGGRWGLNGSLMYPSCPDAASISPTHVVPDLGEPVTRIGAEVMAPGGQTSPDTPGGRVPRVADRTKSAPALSSEERLRRSAQRSGSSALRSWAAASSQVHRGDGLAGRPPASASA